MLTRLSPSVAVAVDKDTAPAFPGDYERDPMRGFLRAGLPGPFSFACTRQAPTSSRAASVYLASTQVALPAAGLKPHCTGSKICSPAVESNFLVAKRRLLTPEYGRARTRPGRDLRTGAAVRPWRSDSSCASSHVPLPPPSLLLLCFPPVAILPCMYEDSQAMRTFSIAAHANL